MCGDAGVSKTEFDFLKRGPVMVPHVASDFIFLYGAEESSRWTEV